MCFGYGYVQDSFGQVPTYVPLSTIFSYCTGQGLPMFFLYLTPSAKGFCNINRNSSNGVGKNSQYEASILH